MDFFLLVIFVIDFEVRSKKLPTREKKQELERMGGVEREREGGGQRGEKRVEGQGERGETLRRCITKLKTLTNRVSVFSFFFDTYLITTESI